MTHILTIARRELSSFFFSPIAYVVMGLFVGLAGLLFLMTVFAPNEPASLRNLFFWLVWILVFIVPAISMRLLSEELRSGTIETLMSAPVTDTQVILGKWLGGLAFFAVLLSTTLILLGILAAFSSPDFGPIFSGYLGLLLVGGLYMAIGTFASVMSRNQIIAFLITVFIILLLTFVTYFLPRFLPPHYAQAVYYINVNEQFDDFARGLIDTSNFVYFLSGITLFLTLAVKTIESRKWR
jgi:ABC-2 type transport system permease protein